MTGNIATSIRAVVFDFDGTLAETRIDFPRMRSLIIEHLKDWGLFEEGCDHGRYILEIVQWAKEKLADRPADQERYAAEARQIMEGVELDSCARARPFCGVPQALARLADCGYRVAIITRNCRAGVQAVMDRYHLHHEVLLTRDDVSEVKPHPTHLLVALDKLQVAPPQAAMVGDHPTDIECAKAAGAVAIGVLTDRTTREQHLEAGADLVVEDVPTLAAVLCEHRPEAG